MMTTMRKRARDAYRYGLASATDVWTRDRAVVDGLSRVAAAGWLRRGRGRGLLGILRQSLAPAGAAERASWCRGIQQRNRTARGGNSLQSIHTHTYTPRGHRYAALATKSCGALVTAAASEIQPRPFVRTGTGCPESAAAARVHGRYHVITMYNPQSPFMRLHVPIREECCEIGRVCFGCASVLSLPLFSHLLTPPLSAERWRSNNEARQNVAGGGPSSFQDYLHASPHLFSIHFDYYYLICPSSLFPSC